MTPDTPLDRLVQMHTYQRPAGSRQERKFINRYIRPFGATVDAFQNWTVVVGDSPRHVWSSHTDTVHKRSGKQRVYLDDAGILSSSSGDCLGADDTAGVWLMTELIRRKVPGRYVFHYGEERGCIGSRNLVHASPDWLADTDMIIALDRMHTDEVITHQCGMRTASDAFADALADQLNAGDASFRYSSSPHGMYTDSESYAEVIAECTNLSVGYTGQHGRSEMLDTRHALALLERLTVLDIPLLPVTRVPGVDDTFWNRYGGPYESTRAKVRTVRLIECPDCGELVDEDEAECDWCGCLYPGDDAERVKLKGGYLDRIYADVQDAIRKDMKRRTNANRKR